MFQSKKDLESLTLPVTTNENKILSLVFINQVNFLEMHHHAI